MEAGATGLGAGVGVREHTNAFSHGVLVLLEGVWYRPGNHSVLGKGLAPDRAREERNSQESPETNNNSY